MLAITRRLLLAACAVGLAISAAPASAQQKPKLRFSAIFSDRDIRAEMMSKFSAAVAEDFQIEPFYNGSLFK